MLPINATSKLWFSGISAIEVAPEYDIRADPLKMRLLSHQLFQSC
jgi:hypothetical protein